MKLVKVILPVAFKDALSYSSADDVEVEVGARVAVELGPRKIYAGIVESVEQLTEKSLTSDFKIKSILGVVDTTSVITDAQLKFWRWVSSYYMCSIGEVMKAFFPASMRMNSVKELFANSPSFVDPYYSKRVRMVGFGEVIGSLEEASAAFDGLSRAKMQSRIFGLMIERFCDNGDGNCSSFLLSREDIEALVGKPAADSALRQLLEKGLIRDEELMVARDTLASHFQIDTSVMPPLTKGQTKAKTEIDAAFADGKSVLFSGVSGSGKTHVYMELIGERVVRGEHVLLLIPEVALTQQLSSRLSAYFGGALMVYNSRLTPAARHKLYNNLLHYKGGCVVVGSRSAVALPFSRLGLVVVDEEHDKGFKQSDPAPRYNARDAALMLAGIHGADSLLCDATPSVESRYNVSSGKYVEVRLPVRYNELGEPKVTVIPRYYIALDERRSRGYSPDNRYFSTYLLKRVGETLERGRQVLLFQNRRGYSSYLECSECGYVPGCPSCNVSLSFHSSRGTLECHYCGYTRRLPSKCDNCSSETLLTVGIGSENVEQRIKDHFPDTTVVRLDSDTLRSKGELRKRLSMIESGESCIIVGTQVVSKGFDFPNLELVGVVNADNMLRFPDFRASESAYQLLRQLSGRLCRGDSSGEMIIQSSETENSVIDDMRRGDYESIYTRELEQRRVFNYPPFVRLIELSLKTPDSNVVNAAASKLCAALKVVFGGRVVGPVAPLVDKVRDDYIVNIYIKVERSKSYEQAKILLRETIEGLKTDSDIKKTRIIVNIDA